MLLAKWKSLIHHVSNDHTGHPDSLYYFLSVPMTRTLSPESGSKKVIYINEPKFTIKAEVHLACGRIITSNSQGMWNLSESGGGPSHELANISLLKLY